MREAGNVLNNTGRKQSQWLTNVFEIAHFWRLLSHLEMLLADNYKYPLLANSLSPQIIFQNSGYLSNNYINSHRSISASRQNALICCASNHITRCFSSVAETLMLGIMHLHVFRIYRLKKKPRFFNLQCYRNSDKVCRHKVLYI